MTISKFQPAGPLCTDTPDNGDPVAPGPLGTDTPDNGDPVVPR